jgi:hypothetical protein
MKRLLFALTVLSVLVGGISATAPSYADTGSSQQKCPDC